MPNLPQNFSFSVCATNNPNLYEYLNEYQIWIFGSLKPIYSFGKWWKLKISLMGFVYRVVWALKPLWIFLSESLKPSIFWENCIKLTFSGCPRKFYHRVMYIAPSSGHISLNLNMLFKFILRSLRLFSDVWSENATLFERLMEIHSNPPILYYGF